MTTINVRRRAAAIVTALAMAAAACSSGDGSISDGSRPAPTEATSDETDDSAPPTTAAPEPSGDLAGAEMASNSVQPFETIEMTPGIDYDGAELMVRHATGDIAIPLYLDGDSARFSAPWFADDPWAGGDLELYLRRGNERSAILALSVGALQPSPGAWDDFIEAFGNKLESSALAAGSTIDEIANTSLDELDGALIPLKIAAAYVDDGTDVDLESLQHFDGVEAADIEMMDALTAALNLTAMLSEPGPIGFGSRSPIEQTRVFGVAATSTPTRSPAPGLGSACRKAGVQVPDAATLSQLIGLASSREIKPGSARRKVLDDIGTVTTIGGFVPGVGWAIAGAGAAFNALEMFNNGSAGLYPSNITKIETDINTPEFPEDFGGPGSWSEVTVTATSTGWSADADIAKTLLSALSAATSAAGGLKVAKMSTADGFALDVSTFLRDNIGNKLVSENAESGGILEFCPETWTVDVSGEPWTTGKAILDRFKVESSSRTYEPIETGLNLPVDDTLRVSLERSLFAGEEADKDFDISVKPIDVDAPERIEVKNPGDEVDISASVMNALFTEVEWEADQGGWKGDAQLIESGSLLESPAVWKRTHVSALQEGQFPYVIAIRSTSTSGLRADGEPPRVATVEVHLADLIIEPENGSVLKRGSIQYIARNRRGEIVDVTWSATGGSIDANGLYTAGNAAGTFSVTATAKADPDLTATVPVTVVDADCVIGDWKLRSQEFLSQISNFAGGGSISYVGGEYLIQLAEDGGYTSQRKQWSFEVSSPQGAVLVTITSSESGSWIVDAKGEQITVNETSSSADVSFSIGGQTFNPGTVNTPGFGGTGTYECDGDVFSVTVTQEGVTVTSTLDRIG